MLPDANATAFLRRIMKKQLTINYANRWKGRRKSVCCGFLVFTNFELLIEKLAKMGKRLVIAG